MTNGGTSSVDNTRKSSVPSVKVDVLRSNIWQNELNIANMDETDDLTAAAEDKKSPTRGGQQKPVDNQSNTIRVLNLAGQFLNTWFN